jgi:hypothetical protein
MRRSRLDIVRWLHRHWLPCARRYLLGKARSLATGQPRSGCFTTRRILLTNRVRVSIKLSRIRITLGENGKLFPAQCGSYSGVISGATDQYVLQRITWRSAVAHDREVLGQIPKLGERARIRHFGDRSIFRWRRNRR